jgi:sulfatase modifying factor 1
MLMEGSGGVATGGAAGAGGAAGSDNACDFGRPSCATGLTCTAGDSCCTSLLVPGGSYNRGGDPTYPATVSSFCLDKYEITVGRLRAFLADYDRWISVGGGSHPQAGEGAHGSPPIAGTGWDSGWTLPASAAELQNGNHLTYCNPYSTWHATPGTAAEERWPINCIDWYEAFAFCIWDGGYLPTEAEWEYAATGGSNQWTYPWGNEPSSDPLPANYCSNHDTPFLPVGSEPAGNGRYGQADLAGSMYEWVFDWYASPYSSAMCQDCANTTSSSYRVMRGGSWVGRGVYLTTAYRNNYYPTAHNNGPGGRCARSIE